MLKEFKILIIFLKEEIRINIFKISENNLKLEGKIDKKEVKRPELIFYGFVSIIKLQKILIII